MLKRITKELFYIKDGVKIVITQDNLPDFIRGDVSGIYGDASGIRGNVAGIRGDVSNIRGDVSGLYGDVSYISGDVSNISGDVSGLYGDIDKAFIEFKDKNPYCKRQIISVVHLVD